MNSLNSSYKVISNFILPGGLGYITYWILETSEIISSSKDTTRTTFLSLLFSVPNYFLYSSLYNCLALPNSNLKTLIALLITLALIALFAPFICNYLIKMIFMIINISNNISIFLKKFMLFAKKYITKKLNSKPLIKKFTSKIMNLLMPSIKWVKSKIKCISSIDSKNNTGVSNGDPWTIINKSGETLVYLYNFNKQLLTCGYGKAFETHADSISIKPNKGIEKENTNYDNVIKYTFKKNVSPMKDKKCCDSTVYVDLNKQFIMIIFEIEENKE